MHNLVAERSDGHWCLFLDRDGVLNRQIVGDYVRHWRQLELLPGVPSAMKYLRRWAPHIVVVTNQQGIGKGLMSGEDVAGVHRFLADELEAHGVVVDGFLVCPHLESVACGCRKPEPGMILEWLRQHPDVDPSLSVVVGDSWSDMEMARRVGMATGGCARIQIGNTTLGSVDARFGSLRDFALAIDNSTVSRDQQ